MFRNNQDSESGRTQKKEQKCRFNLNCNQLQLANSLPDPITRVLVPLSPLRLRKE